LRTFVKARDDLTATAFDHISIKEGLMTADDGRD
jgi:hypothetical protein